MTRHETEVRQNVIDSQLVKSGWNQTSICEEYLITEGAMRFNGDKIARDKNTRFFADYVLFYKNSFPIAVIEAKSDDHRKGMQQAIIYAKYLNIPFAYSCDGKAFFEHNMTTGFEQTIRMEQFPSPEELYQRYKKIDNIEEETHNLITQPYDISQQRLRYYQINAIEKTIRAIANGQRRLLLVMATGTGKTFTAYQIVRKLYLSKKFKKILYLADRNILVDQSIQNEFKPLSKHIDKVKKHHINATTHDIFFALYQQLAGNTEEDYFTQHYKEIPQDYFDFIIIDECHRGSADENSAWRKILEYFSPAVQLGLTATPKKSGESGLNLEYFGEPIYTYSLKQGIEDGFLAPFKVVRYRSSIDDGITVSKGESDIDTGDKFQENTEYLLPDYGKDIQIKKHNEYVARTITDFLKNTIKDRYAKTIIFCETTQNAELLRSEINNLNTDITKNHPEYVVRITGDDKYGKIWLKDFLDDKKRFPVIATTSQLLSTGVNTKLVKVIALNKNINSMTEFKQIIGRGTRLVESKNKKYFTVLDFKAVSENFKDPDFDGIWDDVPTKFPSQPTPEPKEKTKRKVFHIQGREVHIDKQINSIWIDGEVVTENIIEFTRKNVLKNYPDEKDFRCIWNNQIDKKTLLADFEEQCILIEEIRTYPQYENYDEFDILISLAYGKDKLSRSERAKKANKVLAQYTGKSREILEQLLQKYEQNGIIDLTETDTLRNSPFYFLKPFDEIKSIFGDIATYRQAINNITNALYAA